jgi:Flp pilus assembly protein TadG
MQVPSRTIVRPTSRSAFLSMELALTLPILGLLLLAILQFSLLFYARGNVVEASRAGARLASTPGSTPTDIEAEVRRVLDPRLHQGLAVQSELGSQTGDLVAVAVQVPFSSATPSLLWVIGITLDGQNLYAETRMARE